MTLKMTKDIENEGFVASCSYCKRNFGQHKALYAHMRRFHKDKPIEYKQKGNIICTLCGEEQKKMKLYWNHIRLKHPEVNLTFEKKYFYAEDDFKKWKTEIETQTRTHFLMARSQNILSDGRVVCQFQCDRSGTYKRSDKCTRKFSGSKKIGKFCPAYIYLIKTLENDLLEIEVDFQSTHIGHKFSVQASYIRSEERERRIKEKELSMKLKNPTLSKFLGDPNHEIHQANCICKKYELLSKCKHAQTILNSLNTIASVPKEDVSTKNYNILNSLCSDAHALTAVQVNPSNNRATKPMDSLYIQANTVTVVQKEDLMKSKENRNAKSVDSSNILPNARTAAEVDFVSTKENATRISVESLCIEANNITITQKEDLMKLKKSRIAKTLDSPNKKSNVTIATEIDFESPEENDIIKSLDSPSMKIGATLTTQNDILNSEENDVREVLDFLCTKASSISTQDFINPKENEITKSLVSSCIDTNVVTPQEIFTNPDKNENVDSLENDKALIIELFQQLMNRCQNIQDLEVFKMIIGKNKTILSSSKRTESSDSLNSSVDIDEVSENQSQENFSSSLNADNTYLSINQLQEILAQNVCFAPIYYQQFISDLSANTDNVNITSEYQNKDFSDSSENVENMNIASICQQQEVTDLSVNVDNVNNTSLYQQHNISDLSASTENAFVASTYEEEVSDLGDINVESVDQPQTVPNPFVNVDNVCFLSMDQLQENVSSNVENVYVTPVFHPLQNSNPFVNRNIVMMPMDHPQENSNLCSNIVSVDQSQTDTTYIASTNLQDNLSTNILETTCMDQLEDNSNLSADIVEIPDIVPMDQLQDNSNLSANIVQTPYIVTMDQLQDNSNLSMNVVEPPYMVPMDQLQDNSNLSVNIVETPYIVPMGLLQNNSSINMPNPYVTCINQPQEISDLSVNVNDEDATSAYQQASSNSSASIDHSHVTSVEPHTYVTVIDSSALPSSSCINTDPTTPLENLEPVILGNIYMAPMYQPQETSSIYIDHAYVTPMNPPSILHANLNMISTPNLDSSICFPVQTEQECTE